MTTSELAALRAEYDVVIKLVIEAADKRVLEAQRAEKRVVEEIDRLRRELAEAREDSERYKYLKKGARIEHSDGGWCGFFAFPVVGAYRMSVNPARQGEPFDYKDNVDAAIDAARKGQ